jgi:MATE family multidrug resistance protein
VAVGCLVGQMMGENRPDLAKKYLRIVGIFATFCIICFSLVGYFCKRTLAGYFTTNLELLEVMDQTFLILPATIFFDATQGWLGGVIRGLGKQNYGSVICIIAYYPICLPLVWAFAFPLGLKTMGMWIGICIAQTFQIICYLYLIFVHFNWNKTALEIITQLREEDSKKQALVKAEGKMIEYREMDATVPKPEDEI